MLLTARKGVNTTFRAIHHVAATQHLAYIHLDVDEQTRFQRDGGRLTGRDLENWRRVPSAGRNRKRLRRLGRRRTADRPVRK